MRLKSRFVCRCVIIGVLSFLMRGFALLVLRISCYVVCDSCVFRSVSVACLRLTAEGRLTQARLTEDH
jgi:hypothetical protein